MATGNVYWFVPYLKRVFDFQSADFGATPNTIYVALIKSAANGGFDPAPTTPWPTWGASGTTDMSTYQVTVGGEYADGGRVVTLPTTTINGATIELDWENPADWTQNAGSPTNARWAIFYDFTRATKDCMCYYDLGSDRNLATGELVLTMGAPALRITAATP